MGAGGSGVGFDGLGAEFGVLGVFAGVVEEVIWPLGVLEGVLRGFGAEARWESGARLEGPRRDNKSFASGKGA